MASAAIKEKEVQDSSGSWHSLRVRPYLTGANQIDGAVITLVNITAVKAEAIGARSYAEAIVETVPESILVLDENLKVKSANRAFYATFSVLPQNTLGRALHELGQRSMEYSRAAANAAGNASDAEGNQGIKVEHEFPDIGHRVMLLNAYQLNPCLVTPAHPPCHHRFHRAPANDGDPARPTAGLSNTPTMPSSCAAPTER